MCQSLYNGTCTSLIPNMSRYCNFVDFDETGIKLKVLPTQYYDHPLAGRLQNWYTAFGERVGNPVITSCGRVLLTVNAGAHKRLLNRIIMIRSRSHEKYFPSSCLKYGRIVGRFINLNVQESRRPHAI